MALILTSKARTARLVFSGDPAVTLTPAALQRHAARWQRQQVAVALAALAADATDDAKREVEALTRANTDALTMPRVWVPVDDCSSVDGATIASVRALSWLEDQEAQALPPDRQIMRVIESGLVDFNGSTDDRAAFLAAPSAPLVSSLYRAICDLTWGN